MKQSVKLIVGNWKMNGEAGGLAEVDALIAAVRDGAGAAEIVVCPPATLVERCARVTQDTAIAVGGQDCRPEPAGAFTGDISAEALAEAGARFVIVGHSERRHGLGETDALVAAKAEGALRAGLTPIICVGETLEERQAGRTVEVVRGQIAASLPDALKGRRFAVGYEPVWAIGTGLTPTSPEIEEVHRAVRAAMVERLGEAGAEAPIVYGGSVKPSNAAEILHLDEVGGALVGGASLKAEDFLGIIRAA